MNKGNAKYLYRKICSILYTIVVVLIFALLWEYSISRDIVSVGDITERWLMFVVYGIIIIICINVFDGYMIGINRISTSIISQILGLILAAVSYSLILILIIGIDVYFDSGIFILLESVGIQMFFSFIFTWITSVIYREHFPPHKILMVHGDYENNLGVKMSKRDDRYTIIASLHYSQGLNSIKALMKDCDAILINDVPSEERNLILKMCFYNDYRVYFTPKLGDIMVRFSDELKVFDTPIYFNRNAGLDAVHRCIKRVGDILVSILGIIITSPVMLIISLIIKKNDKGSVFYRQDRCTLDGKVFSIIKFRTMRENAEEKTGARLVKNNDERITSVGRVLRRFRLDELPQLFNVIKGDMSIVGPRPERPEIISKYVEDIPEFDFRTKVKAGITGYAQVYGKYNTTDLDKLKMDMMYILQNSLQLDIQLMLLTLRVIFVKEAADGISDDVG